MTTTSGAKTINFAGRAANSPQFDALYAEGMTLVETTAAYLDGPGRSASKMLPPKTAALYSSESLRLTTLLMQLASWLLLQRSLNTGEMSREQVMQERRKLRFGSEPANVNADAWNELPPGFRDLAGQAHRLETRIRKLDDNLMREDIDTDSVRHNQVIAQRDLLKTAFGPR